MYQSVNVFNIRFYEAVHCCYFYFKSNTCFILSFSPLMILIYQTHFHSDNFEGRTLFFFFIFLSCFVCLFVCFFIFFLCHNDTVFVIWNPVFAGTTSTPWFHQVPCHQAKDVGGCRQYAGHRHCASDAGMFNFWQVYAVLSIY